MLLAFLLISSVSGEGCVINPDDSSSWPTWPPILTNQVGDFILPTGTENDRAITLEPDQLVMLSCGVNGSFSYQSASGPLHATCNGGDKLNVWGDGLEETVLSFRDLGCKYQPLDSNLVRHTDSFNVTRIRKS